MKNLIIILAMVVGVTATAQKQMDAFKIQVDGLGCPFCAYGLEKKFKEFKGIKDVKIEIETGDFSFMYPSEKALSLEDVQKQVEKAGYTPITAEVLRADGKTEVAGVKKSQTSNAALTTEEVYVYGNCGMCEARIEKAAKQINGVADAAWSQETKMLKLSFDSAKTNADEVQKAVVKVGHDTKDYSAKDGVYKDLPACCKYTRKDQ